MNESGRHILDCLNAVEAERHRRTLDPDLGRRVEAIKSFQHARFASTYADLLSSRSYAQAARFFLNDLYGPYDFSDRDHQFERIVPALVRIFPQEVVQTVRSLGDLHRISELLDGRMAMAISSPLVDASGYAKAWRTVGEVQSRETQIALTLEIGSALERYTRRPFLRHTLRAMRRPAQIAGLAALQKFLESGFDTFGQMPDPKFFLDTVGRRERKLAAALFGGANNLQIDEP